MSNAWFPSGDRPRRKPTVPVEDYAKIKATLAEGATLASVARHYNVTAQWIRNLCRANGWTWRGRKPGRPPNSLHQPPTPKPPPRPPSQGKGWPKPFRERPTAESRINEIAVRLQADPEYVSAQLKNLGASKRESARKYSLRRRKDDPVFKLTMNVRSRIYRALRQKSKSSYTMRLLGCSQESLVAHLESQFVAPMSWDNYGTIWHVDHIIPLASFDLTKKEHLRAACHWTNLQPLEASQNIKKQHHVSEEVAADVENYVFLVNNVL